MNENVARIRRYSSRAIAICQDHSEKLAEIDGK
jgi:hypothetical protein